MSGNLINKVQSVSALLANRVSDEMRESRKMLDGDHWNGGAGFIGEIGVPKSSRYFKSVEKQVEDGFISQNVLDEICERKSAGILGREPLWKFLPESQKKSTDAQIKLIEEAEAALVKWWNENEMLEKMKDALDIAFPEQRAEFRPFIPSVYTDDNGNIDQVDNLTEALEMLKFEVHSSESAGVFRDNKTFLPFSVFKTVRDDEAYVDISWTDGDGLTHFRSFKESDANAFLENDFGARQLSRLSGANDDSAVDYLKNNFKQIAAYLDKTDEAAAAVEPEPEPFDLKGKLFLYELDLKKPFITKSIKSKQKELNLAFTMKGRNINLAGSRERYFSNTRPPTEKIKVADENAPGGFREERIAAPLFVGAGRSTFLQGAFIRDENGKVTGVANPNVSITEPVSVKNFLETIDAAYAAILAEAQQLHVLMNDTATASGKSRREARAEFEKSLKKLKAKVDALGRWILEFALSFAAVMCGRETEFAEFRCDFDSIVDAGMPDKEERTANIEDYKAGVISLETLRSRNGVEDTDSEKTRIESEPAYEINLLDKILDVLQKANGKLPIRMQIELLAKALGRKDSEVDSILEELAREDPIIQAVLEARNNGKQ